MASPRNTSDSKNGEQDLSVFVKDLLDQMETEFTDSGNSIMGRMDEMGKRMDDLERSIGDLMTDAGLESPKQGELSSSIAPKNSPTHEKETAVL